MAVILPFCIYDRNIFPFFFQNYDLLLSNTDVNTNSLFACGTTYINVRSDNVPRQYLLLLYFFNSTNIKRPNGNIDATEGIYNVLNKKLPIYNV